MEEKSKMKHYLIEEEVAEGAVDANFAHTIIDAARDAKRM